MSKRRVLLRSVVVGALVMSAVALGGSASAAPPANDDIGGAVVINEPLPFSSTQSTLEATTSADETALQSFCGSPAFEHAVWFTATPTQDEIVAVDVSASDYGAGILILTGTPGNLSPVNCQPSRISGPATGGQTYFVVVFGDGTTPATSGNLVLNVATTALVDVNLVSVTEPLTFNLALQGATCTPGTFAVASADANGTTVTPLSVTEDPTNANIASMVLPSDSPPGFLTVEASCSDGTQTIRTEPGETVWAALAVTKAVEGIPKRAQPSRFASLVQEAPTQRQPTCSTRRRAALGMSMRSRSARIATSPSLAMAVLPPSRSMPTTSSSTPRFVSLPP